jgi:transposase
LLLKLLMENRFPSIWMPSKELRDLRTLLLHRHQWVRTRTRAQNALQAMALTNGLRRGKSLWSQEGQRAMASLALGPHAAHRRTTLQALYRELDADINALDKRVREQALERPGARLLRCRVDRDRASNLASETNSQIQESLPCTKGDEE